MAPGSPMPGVIDQIPFAAARSQLQKIIDKPNKTFSFHFDRSAVRNPDKILIAVDNIPDFPFYIIEFKVREDLDLMREIMHEAMVMYRLRLTTRNKSTLQK
ncbi:MAG: hypothetical protein ABIH39_03325 [Candidatus Margulisiibacteriota bacterium]